MVGMDLHGSFEVKENKEKEKENMKEERHAWAYSAGSQPVKCINLSLQAVKIQSSALLHISVSHINLQSCVGFG